VVRTTPPRPVELDAVFPELGEHTRTTTRLHPRPGAPTPADSSIGGPLLWPAGEAWPVCAEDHDYVDVLLKPETVRRWRRILAEAWARTPAGDNLQLTDEEEAALPDLDESEPPELAAQPIAMVPVAQLFRRDVPGFIGPTGADLLQVLWCPFEHSTLEYCPRVAVRWRRAADVTEPLAAAPEPLVVAGEHYLPEPCVVHPEPVAERQYIGLLPDDLQERIGAWEDGTGNEYQYDLSIAPGWKLGGFASWHLTDPLPMDCEACGAPMELLLRAASGEWDGGTGSWRPIEDSQPPINPPEIQIGRGYSLWIFYCPRSFDHPTQTAMQ
jgi:hypothetical protein